MQNMRNFSKMKNAIPQQLNLIQNAVPLIDLLRLLPNMVFSGRIEEQVRRGV